MSDDRLTDRERQVVMATAMGQTQTEIAERLQITVQTVKNHKTTAYAKYGVDNMHALIWTLGWLNPDPVITACDDLIMAVRVWVQYWRSREGAARDQARDDAAVSLMVRQLGVMTQ